jgi:hypothetical protein
MKKTIAIVVFAMLTTLAHSQENWVTVSGGYVFANVENTDANGTGFRINGLYEYNQAGGNWTHGFSFGYMGLSGESNSQQAKYSVNTLPLYYQPKYLFGGEKFKGFVKGAMGWQISHIERKRAVTTLSDKDTGFIGGGGLGAHYFINEKIFLSAEYELLWMSNSFYVDGWLNTTSLGVGIKF